MKSEAWRNKVNNTKRGGEGTVEFFVGSEAFLLVHRVKQIGPRSVFRVRGVSYSIRHAGIRQTQDVIRNDCTIFLDKIRVQKLS